jgi:glyoxylase-like metal-dependent hydrolase (beta-lactamase superfamily II)
MQSAKPDRDMGDHVAEDGASTIDVETLREMLDRGEPVTVLDVRRAEDRAEWAIPGSIHADVYDALRAGDVDALTDVDPPRDIPVVTVCNVGKTSAIAAKQLRTRGLRALTLEGGMKAWSLAWNGAEVPVPGSAARVIQVRRTGKGCLSYIVGSGDEALVVDASVGPEVYLELASENGWKVAGVLETHVPADHLSRARKLAEASGATLYLPEQSRVSYPFSAVRDGDALKVGAATLEAIGTPGHTLESTSYLLDGLALFTGDTLFTAAVGRPDLDADAKGTRQRARALYRSLRRILTLPGETLVLPGHTSEPVAFDREPVATTLAEVCEHTEVLRFTREEFVRRITEHVPPTPANYERIVALNQVGEIPEEAPTDLEAGANRCAVG